MVMLIKWRSNPVYRTFQNLFANQFCFHFLVFLLETRKDSFFGGKIVIFARTSPIVKTGFKI